MEPLSSNERSRLAANGKLNERIAFARAIGNHRLDPVRLRGAMVRTARDYLESRGMAGVLDPFAAMLEPPPAWRGMPTTGAVRTFALLVEFPDYPHLITPGYVEAALFGHPAPPSEQDGSLSDFYRRSSYGVLDLSGTTLGWYRASKDRCHYPETTEGREAIIKEALRHFAALGRGFSQYDNDGTGTIDYFMVFWTGPEGGWATHWWPYETRFSDDSFQVDGLRLGSYAWMSEQPCGEPFGENLARVAIHETGHALGLPDLYDYDKKIGPPGGVGRFDRMDSWYDHNCFSKWMLDWLSPAIIASGSQSVDLAPSGSEPRCVALWPSLTGGQLFTELFMVQNRGPVDNDSGMPADGLAIWHVDATLDATGNDFACDNSTTPHKLIRLMEADGLEEIEAGSSFDDGDLYTQGRSFSATSKPSSARYDGSATGAFVEDIAPSEAGISASLGIR